MKVCFETFGCRLNKAEALQMEADYLAKGWERTEKHSDASLFIVRGCSVTARAQAECEKLISHLKRKYPLVPVRTFGCLENSSKVRKFESSKVDEPQTFKPSNSQTFKPSNFQTFKPSDPLPVRTARAYLKVQDGCSGKCTFCIVPSFRGASVSTPFTDVIDRAKRFIDAGYREIVVTGCNLTLYASEGKRLPELVARLAGVSDSCRIRLGSVEPGPCALETVGAMASHDNVCRFLHVPVQSGSDRILQAMRRPYLVQDIEELVLRATRLMPKLGLGCDVMTGFPDEREADFIMTKTLLSRLPFNNAHVFPFSSRPGTLAAAFPGSVPKPTRSARAHEISDDIQNARNRFAMTFVGKTVEIVVERDDKVLGWTSEYLPCETVGSVRRKSLVRVSVTRIKGDRLYGKLIPGD